MKLLSHARRVTILNIALNAVLFVLKLFAGLASNSIAVLADAANSFMDTFHGCATYWAVKESHKKADKGHQFGHGRAEPMVAFFISLLMAITAFEFLRSAIISLSGNGEVRVINWTIIGVLVIAILAKVLLSYEAGKAGERTRSPALKATAADARNDVLITLTALFGLAVSATAYVWMDEVAAILISVFIFWQAFRIGKENVDYLVGAAPSPELQRKIGEIATTVRGVRGLSLVKAHYVGSFVHVEVHISVNRHISTAASHHIAMTVENDLEELPEVDKAFVSVEPV